MEEAANVVVGPDQLDALSRAGGVRVLEVGSSRDGYRRGHVAGAVYVDWHDDLLPRPDETDGRILAPDRYAELLSRLGVTPDTTVVVYGDGDDERLAMRALWMLEAYGHPDARIMLGGKGAWTRAGHPLDTSVVSPSPSRHPVPAAVDPALRATAQDVRAAIDDPAAVILDVRTDAEYAGTDARARRGGHIPGAAHVEWQAAKDGPGLRPIDELRARYAAAGVTPDKTVITHCQLGGRAAHTWFVLKHVLGYPDVRMYDASWQEWGNRDDTPIESGD